jgi:hypothetical protein
MNKHLNCLFVIFVILILTGCRINSPITGNLVLNYNDEEMIKKISELPQIDENTVLTKENYQEVFSKINFLIDILNKEGGFDFRKLDLSLESFNKLNTAVTRYTPLINNYNEVINNAMEYRNNKIPKNEFYKASGKFGFELTLIITTVFYGAVFQGVGILYRAIGLNRLAFTCPSCISYILSSAYWSATTYLVEDSSKVADWLYTQLNIFIESEGGIEKISEKMKNEVLGISDYIDLQVEKIKNTTSS